jgi:hypothetical protein
LKFCLQLQTGVEVVSQNMPVLKSHANGGFNAQLKPGVFPFGTQ